jgi:photosystem II stability/assembly factor-like uncharacterized protein
MLAIVLLAAAPAAEWQKVDISNLPAAATIDDVAMSADGKYQTAVDDTDGHIYRSEDYGMSWSPAQLPPTLSTTDASLPKPYHKAVAMSSSGKEQAILAGKGDETKIVRLESIDYGKTWAVDDEIPIAAHVYADLALSPDASVSTVVIQTSDLAWALVDNIVIVTKDGTTLSNGKPQKPDGAAISHPFFRVAMSDTGQYQSATAVHMKAIAEYHGVYYSHDFGASWTKATGNGFNAATEFEAYDIAMSADGMIQTAAGAPSSGGGGGFIYRSTDRGQSWTKLETPTSTFSGVAMSANGVIQTVVDNPIGAHQIGQVRTSGDKGASWSVATVPGTSVDTDYSAVAMSRDGAFQTAVAPTGIYRYGTPPTPAPTPAPTPKPAPAPAPGPWMSSAAQTATGITLGTVMAVVPIAAATREQ